MCYVEIRTSIHHMACSNVNVRLWVDDVRRDEKTNNIGRWNGTCLTVNIGLWLQDVVASLSPRGAQEPRRAIFHVADGHFQCKMSKKSVTRAMVRMPCSTVRMASVSKTSHNSATVRMRCSMVWMATFTVSFCQPNAVKIVFVYIPNGFVSKMITFSFR